MATVQLIQLPQSYLEIPSDANGILYIELNDHVREIAPGLAQRLQGGGFLIDPKQIAKV